MTDFNDPPFWALGPSNAAIGVCHFLMAWLEWRTVRPARHLLPVWPRLAVKAALLTGGVVHLAAGGGDYALARWATVARVPVFLVGCVAVATLLAAVVRALLSEADKTRALQAAAARAARKASEDTPPPELTGTYLQGVRQWLDRFAADILAEAGGDKPPSGGRADA